MFLIFTRAQRLFTQVLRYQVLPILHLIRFVVSEMRRVFLSRTERNSSSYKPFASWHQKEVGD